MMKRHTPLLAIALVLAQHLLLSGSLSAQMQDYQLTKGATPTGVIYTGMVRTVPVASDIRLLEVAWETSVGDYWGFGMRLSQELWATAYGKGEAGYGLAVYKLAADESQGQWVDSHGGAIGQEALVGTCYKQRPDGAFQVVPGKYTLRGKNPDGSGYEGTLTLKAESPQVIEALWRTGTSQEGVIGTGFMAHGYLLLCFGEGADGLAVYKETADTGSAYGFWVSVGSKVLGTEQL